MDKLIISLERRLGTCAECSDYPMPATKILDLREYEDEILEIADRLLFQERIPKCIRIIFMTDELTQGERVRLGRELSKSPRLKRSGKKVAVFSTV